MWLALLIPDWLPILHQDLILRSALVGKNFLRGWENDNFKNVFDQFDFLNKENNSSKQSVTIVAING